MYATDILGKTFSLKRLAERALPIMPLSKTAPIKEAVNLLIAHSNINVLAIADADNNLKGGIYYRDMLAYMRECGSTGNICWTRLASSLVKEIGHLDLRSGDEQNLAFIMECISNEVSMIVTDERQYVGIIPSREAARFLFDAQLTSAQGQSPLTGLPGNLQIKHEFDERKGKGDPFRVLYIDINDFKGFNDHYGVGRGDEMIRLLAACLNMAAADSRDIYVGHVGGDDFVLYCSDEAATKLSEKIIGLFEDGKKKFYDKEDIVNGWTEVPGRDRVIRKIPLAGITIAISCLITDGVVGYNDVARNLASLKSLIKKEVKGSAYRIDRREYRRIA